MLFDILQAILNMDNRKTDHKFLFKQIMTNIQTITGEPCLTSSHISLYGHIVIG